MTQTPRSDESPGLPYEYEAPQINASDLIEATNGGITGSAKDTHGWYRP